MVQQIFDSLDVLEIVSMFVFMVASLVSVFVPGLYREGWKNVTFSIFLLSTLVVVNMVILYRWPDSSTVIRATIDLSAILGFRYNTSSTNQSLKEVLMSVLVTTLTVCSALVVLDDHATYQEGGESLLRFVLVFVGMLGWLAAILIVTWAYFRLRQRYASRLCS